MVLPFSRNKRAHLCGNVPPHFRPIRCSSCLRWSIPRDSRSAADSNLDKSTSSYSISIVLVVLASTGLLGGNICGTELLPDDAEAPEGELGEADAVAMGEDDDDEEELLDTLVI